MIRISCQEQLLPGQTLQEKFEFARSAGYDGIELRARGDFAFRDRLPALRRAARDGVPMPSVCVDMAHFFAAFDPGLRRDAIAQLKSQLSVIAEVGGPGAVACTPASWGMFSRRLPPFEPPRSEAEDRAVLLEGLAELGEHAAREGATLALEPLNRYEDHMVNRLEQAVDLVDAVGLPSVKVLADTYHMNIEEDDLVRPVHEVGDRLGYVHIGENQRGYLGSGHLDFTSFFHALADVGYTGPITFESFSSAVVAPGLSNDLAIWRNLWDDREDLARHARAFMANRLAAVPVG
jgi:sugar phosphate isomerase/epimerase